MTKINKDSVRFGLLIATLLPLAIFAIAFLVRFYDLGYIYVLTNPPYQSVFPKMFSICVYPNGLIFYYFIRVNYLKTMRGMLIGTSAMALLMLLLYFVCR